MGFGFSLRFGFGFVVVVLCVWEVFVLWLVGEVIFFFFVIV